MISLTTAGGDQTRRPLLDRAALAVASTHARRMLTRLLRFAEHATDTQRTILLEKVNRNARSQFGRDFGLDRIRTYGDFARQLPVMRYDDLEPYVEQVKSGDVRAMFGRGQRVLMFAKTSGTTNRPKYIPVTTPFLAEYRRGWNAFGIKVIMDHPGCFLRPIVQVTSPMDEERSAGGFPCGAITGLMAATQKRLVRRYYIVPMDVAYVTDAVARYYCVMRFAVTADVAFLITASPATQLRLARTADGHAEQLIRDVRDGTLWSGLEIAQPIRRRLEARLRPDPESARRLEALARRHGRLLPKHFWNLGFLANWTGGTMGLYLRDFFEYFGDTPVRDIGLIASEGRMSIPVEDGTTSGILNVADNFFEFIPAEEYETKDPTILRSHELTVGQEYFVLLTTSAGFYRYDIGDCVRVTGIYHQAPMIEFLHKGVHTSSLTGEKLTEQQVVMAFDEVAGQFELKGRNFVFAPQWSESPFYCLHLEGADDLSGDRQQQLADAYEQSLQNLNIEYASKRATGRLGHVQLNMLPGDWLTRYDCRLASEQRATNEQYKHRFLFNQIGSDREFPIAGRCIV